MSYFFDTSALVKLYHREEGTEKVLGLYNSESSIMISELAKIEFYSTVYRKFRERELAHHALNLIIEKFDYDIDNRYTLLFFSPGVMEQAQKILKMYGGTRGIKTLDSLQLGFFEFYGLKEDYFVCWDSKLLKIAQEEGVLVFAIS